MPAHPLNSKPVTASFHAPKLIHFRAMSTRYDADFDPFGGEHVVTNTCPQNYKFTGKERDTESNLDNFEARYYSSQFGRFQSADWSAVPVPVPYADLGNPQTLNLYAYVKNNPMNLSDPSGHQAEGALVGVSGEYMAARMRAGGEPLGPGDAVEPGVWEVTINGESSFVLGSYADAEQAASAAQNTSAHQAQNKPQYDPKKSGPEDPTNPGHPLSQNPAVKKASDEAWQKTMNGTARNGRAEAGGTIEYKDGKIFPANQVNSVNGEAETAIICE